MINILPPKDRVTLNLERVASPIILIERRMKATADTTLGIVTADIPVNGEGNVTVFGEVRGINLSLLNNGKLIELFTDHYVAATSLNTIQDNTGVGGIRAVAVAGREFEVDDLGVLTVVPLPEPVIEDYPVDPGG